MKQSWFNQIVESWIPNLAWTKAEKRRISNLLEITATANGGEVLSDKRIRESLLKEHACRRVDHALSRGVNGFYKSHSILCEAEDSERPNNDNNSAVHLSFLQARSVQRICDESGNLNRFVADPSFKNYLRWRTNWKRGIQPGAAEKRLIEDQLLDIVRKLERGGYNSRTRIGRSLASETSSASKSFSRARRLYANGFRGPALGTLLTDDNYPKFVSSLLRSADKSVHIIMFFMTYQEKSDSSTAPLIQELIRAKKRGVEIHVILDKDAEGDVYGSRIINAKAFQKFQDNGIHVCYDREQEVTHTKLVVVDSRHTVIGSHNWTKGSFQSYDDTSLYIESEAVAKDYIKDFKIRWASYSA